MRYKIGLFAVSFKNIYKVGHLGYWLTSQYNIHHMLIMKMTGHGFISRKGDVGIIVSEFLYLLQGLVSGSGAQQAEKV